MMHPSSTWHPAKSQLLLLLSLRAVTPNPANILRKERDALTSIETTKISPDPPLQLASTGPTPPDSPGWSSLIRRLRVESHRCSHQPGEPSGWNFIAQPVSERSPGFLFCSWIIHIQVCTTVTFSISSVLKASLTPCGNLSLGLSLLGPPACHSPGPAQVPFSESSASSF